MPMSDLLPAMQKNCYGRSSKDALRGIKDIFRDLVALTPGTLSPFPNCPRHYSYTERWCFSFHFVFSLKTHTQFTYLQQLPQVKNSAY